MSCSGVFGYHSSFCTTCLIGLHAVRIHAAWAILPGGVKEESPCLFLLHTNYSICLLNTLTLNTLLFAVAECGLKECLPVHTEDGSGCHRSLPVHVQPQSVHCSALKCLSSSQCSWHTQVPVGLRYAMGVYYVEKKEILPIHITNASLSNDISSRGECSS